MINFTPVGKRYLVKQINKPETSAGGIIISTRVNTAVYEALITAVGTGYADGSNDLNPGDRVLLTKWVKHDELENGDESFMVIDTDSVIALLKD